MRKEKPMNKDSFGLDIEAELERVSDFLVQLLLSIIGVPIVRSKEYSFFSVVSVSCKCRINSCRQDV